MNGIDCFFEGLRLMWRPGIRAYVIIPFTLNALVFVGIVFWGVAQYDALSSSTGLLPEWLFFLAGIVAFIAGVAAFLAFVLAFAIVASIISSPFLALLAEKVETQLTGVQPSASGNLLVIAIRALGREVAKALYYLPRLLGIFLLTLIPGVNVASPLLWALFGAWMMTIQFTDYAADNNGVAFRDLRNRLGTGKFQAIVFGLVAYVALAIPVVNIILIPAAVSGGTVFWVKRLRR